MMVNLREKAGRTRRPGRMGRLGHRPVGSRCERNDIILCGEN